MDSCQQHRNNQGDIAMNLQEQLLSFTQEYNNGCQWDSYYGFWYRAVCDAETDSLRVTMYVDFACKQKAKRAQVNALSVVYPGLGACSPHVTSEGNVTQSGFRLQYCRK